MNHLEVGETFIRLNREPLRHVTDAKIYLKAGAMDKVILTLDARVQYSGKAKIRLRRHSIVTAGIHKIRALVSLSCQKLRRLLMA